MTFTDITNILINFRNKKIITTVFAILVYLSVSYYQPMHDYTQELFDNRMDAKHTTNYMVYSVWWYSDIKSSEIRSFLYEFYPYTDLNRKQVQLHIDNILKTNTNKYIQEFNSAPFAKDNLGTWYGEEFRYNAFLEDVMDIINDIVEYETEDERALIIENKIGIIFEIMKSYQFEMSGKLTKHLNEK